MRSACCTHVRFGLPLRVMPGITLHDFERGYYCLNLAGNDEISNNRYPGAVIN